MYGSPSPVSPIKRRPLKAQADAMTQQSQSEELCMFESQARLPHAASILEVNDHSVNSTLPQDNFGLTNASRFNMGVGTLHQ